MSKTTYKVLAAKGYRGHEKGEEVELSLTKEEERRATARGSIKRLDDNPKGAKNG